MLAIPLGLYLVMRIQGAGHSDSGMIASWPAFLLWPFGLALIAGDMFRRFVRWIDGDADDRIDRRDDGT